MSPNPLPCTDINECASLGGLLHHPMAKMTNTKNGKAKIHAMLLCPMDQQPIELKGCVNHNEPQHRELMKYDGMSKGMVNQG
jgi:hypothetical protein